MQIIGVEPKNCASWSAALRAGRPTRIEMGGGTLADGLAVPEVGANAFATCQAHNLVDEVVTVDEHAIALAILRLVEIEQAIVEGGGGAGLAALLDVSLTRSASERDVTTGMGLVPQVRPRSAANFFDGGRSVFLTACLRLFPSFPSPPSLHSWRERKS